MTIMLPLQVLLIPQYIAFQGHWLDRHMVTLIVPTFFANAYNVFLLSSTSDPAARAGRGGPIDGATASDPVVGDHSSGVAGDHRVSLFHFFFS